MSARKHGRDSWWEDRSIAQKVFMGIGFGILGAGFLFTIGLVTMLLWNKLMPEIFGLTRITYWQTWGLLILSFIFFKSWGNGESGGRRDRKRKRKLRQYLSEDGSDSGPSSDETGSNTGAADGPAPGDGSDAPTEEDASGASDR